MNTISLTTPWHMMSDVAVVYAPSIAVGTSGAEVTTYPSGVDFACALQVDNSRAGQQYMRETGTALFTGFFPPDATVKKGYRCVVDGATYRVIGPARDLCMAGVIQAVTMEAQS